MLESSGNINPSLSSRRFINILTRYVSLRLLFLMLLIFGTGVLLVIYFYPKSETSIYFYILSEIGKALFITAMISGAVKWYLTRQTIILENTKNEIIRDELKKNLEELKDKVLSQTKVMTAASKSLDALKNAGIVEFYENRSRASKEIEDAIENKNVKSLKIIGISLNDFVRDEHPILHKAWKTVEDYIKSDKPPRKTENIEIKLLIIDPMSNGAFLRGSAEGTEDSHTRLYEDVIISMRHFRNLEKISSIGKKVKFSAKIYRTPPIMYLVWTPETSFVQQYYFRPKHSADINIPVIQYHSKDPFLNLGNSIHDELQFHFDWIWDNAAFSLQDYFKKHNIGIDSGSNNANIINIYYEKNLSQQKSKERILYLIKNTQKRLWIKGISLKSFFKYGDLFDAISNACSIAGLDIKVLLIDPDCDQAKIRSFREYLMNDETRNLSYFNDEERRKQPLYKDTMDSITNIRDHIKELNNYCNKHNFSARIYHSSPEAFILITDESALIEQYHYGKIRPTTSQSSKGKILGGDFPVIEYKRNDKDSFDPYKILNNHFEFVFTHCSKDITIE